MVESVQIPLQSEVVESGVIIASGNIKWQSRLLRQVVKLYGSITLQSGVKAGDSQIINLGGNIREFL